MSLHDFLVYRTVDVRPGLLVQLRVPLSTARLWSPEVENELMLRAAADRRAVYEVQELMRARGIADGCWRVTWRDDDVLVEPGER
jgi:hypothetical protein